LKAPKAYAKKLVGVFRTSSCCLGFSRHTLLSGV